MGKITHMLAKKEMGGKCDLFPTRLITEENKKESIHLHMRNIRLELSNEEFINLAQHTFMSRETLLSGTGVLRDDGRDEFKRPYFVLYEKKINNSPKINKNKFQIEINHPNVVHIHIRNFRLELSFEEFLEIAALFKNAISNFEAINNRK